VKHPLVADAAFDCENVKIDAFGFYFSIEQRL
jgi:hypothetical protein